jgi:hypothetical protein
MCRSDYSKGGASRLDRTPFEPPESAAVPSRLRSMDRRPHFVGGGSAVPKKALGGSRTRRAERALPPVAMAPKRGPLWGAAHGGGSWL